MIYLICLWVDRVVDKMILEAFVKVDNLILKLILHFIDYHFIVINFIKFNNFDIEFLKSLKFRLFIRKIIKNNF